MVDSKQINQWLKEGTITQAQASKMLSDSSVEESEDKSNKFISVISIIGAVLIFIGFAWLIARNWHQIPDALKVLILLGATLAAFIVGVMLRQSNHEGVGRSLITLGALLFILSLFLISQTYNLVTSMQHYAWLLFFAWIIIALTAYFLDSPENLVVTLLVFFPWVILQYLSSVNGAEEGIVLGFVLIFLSAGSLLYGLSVLHNSIKHKFTNVYRFWTALYFLLIFYVLSFQSILPILSNYSFEGGTFSALLVLFIIICFFGFVIGLLFATSKSSVSLKEILGFVSILAILLILVISTKAGAGTMGTCYPKSCYDFKNSAECNSPPGSIACEWRIDEVNSQGFCNQLSCYSYPNETGCNSAANKLGCSWENNYCVQQRFDDSSYQTCSKNDNQKDSCLAQSLCKWQQSYGLNSGGLPTSLWLLWIINNLLFIGFIILMIRYGQSIGAPNIVGISIQMFILDIISRYIGFWMDLKGYFAFSILAILGGLMLILGAWQIPKWRRKLLEQTKQGASI